MTSTAKTSKTDNTQASIKRRGLFVKTAVASAVVLALAGGQLATSLDVGATPAASIRISQSFALPISSLADSSNDWLISGPAVPFRR